MGGDNSTVFVDGLPSLWTGGHLRRLFGRCGSVDEAFVVRKKRTHSSGPYGFVIFRSENEALEAVKSLDGERVAGCRLKVCVAKYARKRDGGGREEEARGSRWSPRFGYSRWVGSGGTLSDRNWTRRVGGEWRRGGVNCWGREEIGGMLLGWGLVRKVQVVKGVKFRSTNLPCQDLILVRGDVACLVKVEDEVRRGRRGRRRRRCRRLSEVPKLLPESKSMDEKVASFHKGERLAEDTKAAGLHPVQPGKSGKCHLLFSSVSTLACRKFAKPPPALSMEGLPPMEGTNGDEPTVIRGDRDGAVLRSKSEEERNKQKDMSLQPLIRWRKGDLIGKGAFGRVHMGLNLDSGELLAVKEVAIPSNTSKKTQVYIGELEKEVNLLKNLSHPNIVRYLGTAREDDSLNILLEFVPGGSISSLLGKFGSFPESVIRMYTKQILCGLDYLHKNKIMHRDIKGANILVDNKGCIKLADFGASKKVEALASITGAESMKGTPHWMAPEVIVESGHSYSADIWSVGCTVIEMATGKPPWSPQYQEVAAVLLYVGKTKSHPPIPDDLSVEAEDFLLKCLQKEPDLRPTASELLKHPFVTELNRKSHTVLRSSLIDGSKKRMTSHGVEIKKLMNLETRSSCKGFGEFGGSANCSTFHPEQGSLWKPVNFEDDDDMCRIDDDLVLGASNKFNHTLPSRDCNQSFNPMCEPNDDQTYKSDISPDSEMTKCCQIYGSGNRSFGHAEVGSGFTSPTEDDEEETEANIRAFLNEKAMEPKQLQSPLYEFYNSLNVSRRMSCIGSGRFAERERKWKEAKPVHNYSIQTGEEFSLEFMRDRFNPKKLIPGNSADSSQAPGYLDLKGINYTECESGSDISKIATADKESREFIQNNSSIHGGVKGSFQSMQQDPHASSVYSTSSGTSDSSSTILCSFGGRILPRPSDGDSEMKYVVAVNGIDLGSRKSSTLCGLTSSFGNESDTPNVNRGTTAELIGVSNVNMAGLIVPRVATEPSSTLTLPISSEPYDHSHAILHVQERQHPSQFGYHFHTPYYTHSEIALPQPSVLPVSELKDLEKMSLNDSDILSKDTQEKDAELKGDSLIQPELEKRQNFAFVVPSQARGVNTEISLDSSAVTVPKLEMLISSKDLNSEGMLDETLLISKPPDVIFPSSGNEYFPSGNSPVPESNPSDSTYFDSSLPPQIPREQGELLNRISKSDDSHNSQFLANQSHTDNSDSSQFLINPDNSHNSQFLVNPSHTDDSQQDLIAAPVENISTHEQSISTEMLFPHEESLPKCCSLMYLKLLITSLLKI